MRILATYVRREMTRADLQKFVVGFTYNLLASNVANGSIYELFCSRTVDYILLRQLLDQRPGNPIDCRRGYRIRWNSEALRE